MSTRVAPVFIVWSWLSFRFSVAVSPAPGGEDAWFLGCVDASSGMPSRSGAGDLDPVQCSALCLEKGCTVAAMTLRSCYCGNKELLQDFPSIECLNTSVTKHVRGKREVLLPFGGAQGNLALYRTSGPFLHSIRLSVSPDRVIAGRPFTLHVFGNLARRLNQSTGILGLGRQDLSNVTVEFLGMTPKGQSSYHVNMLDDGSFNVSCNWSSEAPGIYEIKVIASNILSTLSSALRLSVWQPSPDVLVISLLRGPLGAAPCIHLLQLDSYKASLKAAYLNDTIRLQANVHSGSAAEFHWCLSLMDVEETGTVDWIFKKEGLHMVFVNATSSYRWTQGKIYVDVVRRSVSENLSRAEEMVSLDVEQFMKDLPLLSNLTLETEHCHSYIKVNMSECCFAWSLDSLIHNDFCNTAKNTITHNHTRSQTDEGMSYCESIHGNISYDYNVSQQYCKIHCKEMIVHSNGSHANTQKLLHTFNFSCCLLHLHLSDNWKSEFSADETINLAAGSQLVWTLSLNNVIVINQTMNKWHISRSLKEAECFNLTLKAFNGTGWASLQTNVSVQDPVGDLVLNIPANVTANQNYSVFFSIGSGSNVTVSLLVNGTLLYRNSSYSTGEEAEVVLLFHHTGTAVVELKADNRVSSQSKDMTVWVKEKRESAPQCCNAVKIHAEKQAYPTNTEINLLALTDLQENMEFLWRFGDSTSARTISSYVTKRYSKPGRYNVTVVLSTRRMSISSEPFPLAVQRAVKLNRLVHQASVLQNHSVTISCRVNVGTELSFRWRFGDGSFKLGPSTEQHVFDSLGDFIVEVIVFNLVSSASLSSHIFVVDRPCQPPPVKNMGPLTLKVRRSEVVHLGVTYETEFDCDIYISGGIEYSWTLYDSTGQVVPLPHIDTHRQSLILPSHFLHYDTFTAIAKVKIVGSVVYSNYSVRVQVIQSRPVAVVRGGTNVFINNKNTTVVTLDGTKSYDSDFPLNTLRLNWICKPISTITSSCFDQHVPTSSPVLTFPATFLKQNFDQFRFTLTAQSAGRSASSDVFLTVKANLLGKVSADCPKCEDNQVNWDQSFSVHAFCEDCPVSPKQIHYTWRLYQVNASSKPVTEVPFCHTLDLSSPSAIKDKPKDSAGDTQYTSPLFTSTRQRRSILDPELDSLGSGEDLFDHSPEEFDPFESSDLPSEYSGHIQYSDSVRHSRVDSKLPDETDSSADWDFSHPIIEKNYFQDTHYDPFLSAEEGESELSPGRSTVEDGEIFDVGDDSAFDVHRDEGSNLVDARPPVMVQEPTLLDLPRDPVDQWIFESYTHTGISSSQIIFKPFSLMPGSRYMLEVTASDNLLDHFFGRTQLFFETKPAPKGMTCQVQPLNGMELHTVFSIFCSSGKEDLLFKYSFSVGDKPPQTLYRGRDFEYYFNLPAGDPSDDYKVTVYIEIRSSINGGATRPCPVTVRVLPHFLRGTSSPDDPVLELSEIALRNLSSLIQLGNSVEILNYISIVSSILNRLSLDPEANTESQINLRNMLVCIVCEIETTDQVSVIDTIYLLKALLQFTNQVTLAAAGKVTAYVQKLFSPDSSASALHPMNQETVDNMAALLSSILQAVTSYSSTLEITNSADISTEIDPSPGKHRRNAISRSTGCLRDSTGAHTNTVHKQQLQLVDSIMHTASIMMLRFISLQKMVEARFSTGVMSVYATNQNQRSTICSGSSVFYMPTSLIQHLDTVERNRQGCVLGVVTELTHSPYTWADHPVKLTGPVVELSLYRCSTRKKLSVRFLPEPFIIKLHPPKNQMFMPDNILHHNKINYHSFNISHEHLQHAIQIRVQFTPSSNKMFPVMLLFRMFERPTPSVYHLRRIYNWETNITHITLPSSYLSGAGVGYLALLNADFAKPHRWRLFNQVSYSLTVDSSLCLSWDSHQGAWTPHGCKTQAGDTTSAVNCSCHQLRPVTVVQQQITSSHDTTEVEPFISVSHNWTVLIVLLLCVCFYISALVMCRNLDDGSGEKRVHYLSDNLPCEPYLYAVTIHTGLCSAAVMSAKVYIVLCGEDGFSQTKELQVPGCFRRNSRDTFIISAAENLRSLCGIHIWHDNSGPSPTWYLKRVEVCELNRDKEEGRAWLFVSQCWLAVDKSDGRVERMLRVCNQEMGFAKMLYLKVCDYMADFHIWISVYSCPRPNRFTRCQRLSMCLLLVLGYSCVSTVIISQMDDKLSLELGLKDFLAIAVKTGLLGITAVLPAATVLSFLFRLHEVKLVWPEVKCTEDTKTDNCCLEEDHSLNDTMLEPYFSWSGLQQWLQEAWRKKYQDTDISSVSMWDLEDKGLDEKHETNVAISKEDIIIIDGKEENQSSCLGSDLRNLEHGSHQARCGQTKNMTTAGTLKLLCHWCHCVAWVLWLLLCTSSLGVCALLGIRFNNSEVLLWIQSLYSSLLFCIFLFHPLMVLLMAVLVSICHRHRADFQSFFTFCRHKSVYQPKECTLYQGKSTNLQKLLEARQRARFLHLVRPPSPTELRKSQCKRKKESLISRTMWDWCVFASMLFLMLCITYGSSISDLYNLNRAVRKHFISGQANDFMSIQTYDDWWGWAQTRLLNALYKNSSATTEFDIQQSPILIGEPVLLKKEIWSYKTPLSHTGCDNVDPVTMACTHSEHYSGPSAKVSLGCTKTSAASKLKLLHSEGWQGRQTVALKVHFTLYSPAPNLFTSVALSFEPSATGVLLPLANVHSVRVFYILSAWDYIVMVCQLLFVILLLLRLCHQILTLAEKGLMKFCKIPCNWLEVSLLTVGLVYYVYCIYQSVIVTEVAELLQTTNYRMHVDLSELATCDQNICSLCGTLLLLLTLRCVCLLKVNRTTLLTRFLSSFQWPVIAGLIFLVALSRIGNLLHVQSSWAFSSFPQSLQTVVYHRRGPISAKVHLVLRKDVLYYRAIYVLSRLVWTALVINILSSPKRSLWRRRDTFTTAELVDDIRRKLFTGWHRSTHTDNYMERRTYHLEEFESVLDELLFRLNALSNSWHQTEACKAYCYRNDSPVSPSQGFSKIETQDYFKTQMTEEHLTAPNFLQRRDQGDKIFEETEVHFNQHETRTQNSSEERVSSMLTFTQVMPSEMVVKVLVHKEQDNRDNQVTY